MDNKDTACGQADNPGNSASLWKSPYILILIFTICTAVSLEILHYALPSVFARSLSASMAVQINTNPLFATACLGGAAAYFLILKASAAERLTVIFLGSIIDAFFIKERLSIIGPVGQLLHLGIGLCALSIIASIVHAIKAKISGNAEELRKSLEVCGLISVMPILLASSGCYGGGGPLVYDPHLYAMDSIWGVQPGFIIAKVMSSTKILRVSMYIVYFYLSLWMMLAQAAVYLHNEQTGKKHNSFLIPALFFILIALGGSWFYAYFPAVGEMYYCGLRYYPNGPWPEASLSPSPIEAPFELSRNCMPSLHFSWIIASALCVWNLGKILQSCRRSIDRTYLPQHFQRRKPLLNRSDYGPSFRSRNVCCRSSKSCAAYKNLDCIFGTWADMHLALCFEKFAAADTCKCFMDNHTACSNNSDIHIYAVCT